MDGPLFLHLYAHVTHQEIEIDDDSFFNGLHLVCIAHF